MTTIEDTRARWGAEVEARIHAALEGWGALTQMGRYHMDTGGKRLRALLPALVAANAGGEAGDAIELGVGIELIHNATLVHDDLQDGDEVRRKQPAVWKAFGATQAINLGDALFFMGLERVALAPAGPGLLTAVSRAVTRVVGGQSMEFQLQLPSGEALHLAPTLDNWEAMARAKTGALFGLCCQAGAAAAGRSADEVEAVRSYGEDAGLLFQVQDDYLDLIGDKGRARRGSDLAEGKLSFPVVWVLTEVGGAEASRLREIVETPRAETPDAWIDEGLALLERVGALEATAVWLRDRRDALARSPVAAWVPGLVERFLAPVRHAL